MQALSTHTPAKRLSSEPRGLLIWELAWASSGCLKASSSPLPAVPSWGFQPAFPARLVPSCRWAPMPVVPGELPAARLPSSKTAGSCADANATDVKQQDLTSCQPPVPLCVQENPKASQYRLVHSAFRGCRPPLRVSPVGSVPVPRGGHGPSGRVWAGGCPQSSQARCSAPRAAALRATAWVRGGKGDSALSTMPRNIPAMKAAVLSPPGTAHRGTGRSAAPSTATGVRQLISA